MISATQVKALRERTGLGMMECKKALEENAGDTEKAITALRKAGSIKAAKKSSRVTAEGVIATQMADDRGVIVEVNCETDFVARDKIFLDFVQTALVETLKSKGDYAAVSNALETPRLEAVQKLGENIVLQRLACLTVPPSGCLSGYTHTNKKIGVLVTIDRAEAEIAHDLAMHIAALRPLAVKREEVAAEIIAKEQEIYQAQVAQSDKPTNIQEKMVEGKMRKFLDSVVLLQQDFVKDPTLQIGKMLAQKNIVDVAFRRFEVGDST